MKVLQNFTTIVKYFAHCRKSSRLQAAVQNCQGEHIHLSRCCGTMASEEAVKGLWRRADAVCFDVDSTVCIDESIDELAAFLGVGDQVAALTNQAMDGSMTFKEALGKRLQIMSPSRQQIAEFLSQHPPRLTHGIRELVQVLHKRNVPVYLITGGFQSIVEMVAGELNIPKENIFANRLLFYYDGQYAGFDEKQPTCEAGGKPLVVRRLKEEHSYKQLVHIGDGVTDMEACPPADAFIGFGANKVRDNVKSGSKWFVISFQEMIDELKKS